MHIAHIGASGLALSHAGARLLIDPQSAPDGPTVLTWTETERVAGVRARAPSELAAAQTVLDWLSRPGTALGAEPVRFAGWTIVALPFAPIPYATPREAVRKALSAVRSPLRALERLRHLARRPHTPPLVLSLTREGRTIALLGQALHRYTSRRDLDRLVQRFHGADVLIAGTDYDDEKATGRHCGAFNAKTVVIADLTGPVRRMLQLPTRPLTTMLRSAPKGTLVLEEFQRLTIV
jgi:hypothetical protein